MFIDYPEKLKLKIYLKKSANNRFNKPTQAIVKQNAEMVLIGSNFGLNWEISC